MIATLRRHLVTIVVAFITAAVTAGGPPLAAAVFDAQNADKVDGRHAVWAGATASQRAGKLVATSKAGRLPNNIIAKAPNADRLDGKNGAAYAAHNSATRITQSEYWHQLFSGFELLHQGGATRFSRAAGSSSTSLTTELFLTYPVTSYGRAQQLVSVEVCVAPQNVTVDHITVYAENHTGGIFGGGGIVVTDQTNRTENGCALLTPTQPFALETGHMLNVQVNSDGWNGSSQFLFVGRVTSTYRAVPS